MLEAGMWSIQVRRAMAEQCLEVSQTSWAEQCCQEAFPLLI